MNHAPGGGEPHRALVDTALDAIRTQRGRLAGDGTLPDLSQHWPALWRSAVLRQVALTDEPEQMAQESVRSMLAQLANLHLDAAWFRDDRAARERAIAETLLFGTQLSDAVPSRAAQQAWQRLRERPGGPPDAREDWLAAWNAWNTGSTEAAAQPEAAQADAAQPTAAQPTAVREDTVRAKAVRSWEGWLVVVAAIVLVAACCAGLVYAVQDYRTDGRRAAVGDCLDDDDNDTPAYRLVDCDDKAARYTVLTVTEADGNPCVEVPGASRLYRIDGRVFCVAAKGADPARSVNVAKDGDCLRIGGGNDAERLDCTDPNANVKILRRLTAVTYDVVPGFERGPCADVPGTVLTSVHTWKSDAPPDPRHRLPGKHADLMFCLTRVNTPPPAVPDAKPPCQYVAGDVVLAAVNAAGGNRFGTVYANTAGPMGCEYQLLRNGETSRGSASVSVRLGADTTWPPSPDLAEFDVDGVKAAWRVNEYGGGSLYVARPTGRFEIVLRLDRAFPDARGVALAIYRAAAPHVP